jgi:hypothetical protein
LAAEPIERLVRPFALGFEDDVKSVEIFHRALGLGALGLAGSAVVPDGMC